MFGIGQILCDDGEREQYIKETVASKLIWYILKCIHWIKIIKTKIWKWEIWKRQCFQLLHCKLKFLFNIFIIFIISLWLHRHYVDRHTFKIGFHVAFEISDSSLSDCSCGYNLYTPLYTFYTIMVVYLSHINTWVQNIKIPI